jgi:hypothetical protein
MRPVRPMLAGRVFPGNRPVRCFCLPARSGWPRALTQDHTIAGKRLRLIEPALAPTAGFLCVPQGLGIVQAVAEAQSLQGLQALWHVRRAIRPIPDEQADGIDLLLVERLSRHQACHLATGANPTVAALHVTVQAPVELALQHGIEWFLQVCGNGWQLPCAGCPVLAQTSIATADGLSQRAVSVDQGDRDTVDLGLNPQVVAGVDPFGDCCIVQFAQPGLRHRVRDRSAAASQRVCQCRAGGRKAPMPGLQALAGLVIDFISHQRAALIVIGVVPLGDLLIERGELGLGAISGPVGARAGLGGEWKEQQSDPALHIEHPCSDWTSGLGL